MIFGITESCRKLDDYYSPGQVESVLVDIGVDIIGETDTNLLCLCPFHHNTDTPALSVEKDRGIYLCFAPHCEVKGTLTHLVKAMTKGSKYSVMRIIDRHKSESKLDLQNTIEDLFNRKNELPVFDQNILNRMHEDMWSSPAQEYMNGRGFTDKTLQYFSIGYSIKNQMVTIPVHDWEENPVGIIGRTIEGKRFKNSKKLPTRQTLFNIHRAKKTGDKIIIVESAMDAMRLHQCGFPYVVSTNGSIFSDAHVQLINRYFNEVIIMTDMDDPKDHVKLDCNKCENTCLGHIPGRALGEKIVKSLPGKRILWSAYDYGIVYPHGAKDVGDLDPEEIKQCIKNAVNTAEYQLWKREFPLLNIL